MNDRYNSIVNQLSYFITFSLLYNNKEKMLYVQTYL